MPRIELSGRGTGRVDGRCHRRPTRTRRRNFPASRSGCWCRSRRAAASMWWRGSSGRRSARTPASRCWSRVKPGAGGAIAVNELMRRRARRLHAAGDHQFARHAAGANQAAVASEQRLHAGRRHLFDDVRHGDEPGEHVAVQDLAGVPHLCAGQSRQDQLGLVGHRRAAASRRHAVHQGRRHRHGPRALSRQRADAAGAAAERRPAHVRHADAVDAAHQGGQAHGAGRHRRPQACAVARRADRQGSGEARLHHRDLDFRDRPEGHPRAGAGRAERGVRRPRSTTRASATG